MEGAAESVGGLEHRPWKLGRGLPPAGERGMPARCPGPRLAVVAQLVVYEVPELVEEGVAGAAGRARDANVDGVGPQVAVGAGLARRGRGPHGDGLEVGEQTVKTSGGA